MPFPDCVPELTDGVVRLRAHRPEDASGSSSSPPTRSRCAGPPCRAPTASTTPATSSRDRARVERPATACAAGRSRMPRTRTARYLGTVDLRPRGGGAAETGFGLHPEGRGSGFMAGCAAARLPLVVRRGRRAGALAGRARELRLVAGGVVVRVHPPRHRPAVAPRPRRPRGAGARRVAGQPRGRRRHGAPHAVGGRAGAGGGGGRTASGCGRGATATSTRSSRGTSPTTTCRPEACSTPTPSPSG